MSSVELEIDPLKAKAAKDRRIYHLNVVEIPALRVIGFALLGVIVWLHNAYIVGSISWKEIESFGFLALSYSLLAWLVLYLGFEKVARVHLGTLFLSLDILVWIAAIYYSGGEKSLLFFVLFIRVADQANTTFKRVLLFSHVTVLGYLLLLVYLSFVQGRVIPWTQETIKLLLLYVANIYISLTARTAENIRKRTSASMQLARDLVAQLKKNNEDLDEAKAKAEEANRAKSEFLANMSHELKTPLNHIIGFSELMVDRHLGDLNETQEGCLQDMLRSSKHLLALINDTLDLSKIEVGKTSLSLSEVKVRAFLNWSESTVIEKAMGRGFLVAQDVGEVPETLVADGEKLKKVMDILLSNAVKFSPRGGLIRIGAKGVQVLVRPGLRKGDSMRPPIMQRVVEDKQGATDDCRTYIEFAVTDAGIGLRVEDLERIFDPFEQADSAMDRNYGGAGLGLSLARSLVELHRGKIWAESEGEGKGSTFRFIIPHDSWGGLVL